MLTREHAEVEFQRTGMSLQTDEEEASLIDPVGGRSGDSEKGPPSPLIVGPAGLRESITEYKAAMQQVGCVLAPLGQALSPSLRSSTHAGHPAVHLELDCSESNATAHPRCSFSSLSLFLSLSLSLLGTT